jgi:hypothetical protein
MHNRHIAAGHRQQAMQLLLDTLHNHQTTKQRQQWLLIVLCLLRSHICVIAQQRLR